MVNLIFKRLLKLLFFISLVFFLGLSLISLLLSNKESTTKLFQVISGEMGYETNIEISKLDWSLTKQIIFLEDFKVKKIEERNSLNSNLLEIEINWLNLLNKSSFLGFRTDFLNIELEDFDLNNEVLDERSSLFFIKNIKTDIKEINLKGSIKEINLTEYFSLFSNSVNYTPFILKAKDLFVSNLRIGPLQFLNTRIQMLPVSKGREFNFSNKQLNGNLVIKQPLSEGLEINLSTLNLDSEGLNSASTFEYLFENLTIPINFSVNQLFIKNIDYGSLSFFINREEEGLYFNNIEVSFLNLEEGVYDKRIRDNRLFIYREDSKPQSTFQGFLNTDNLTEYINRFNEEGESVNFLAGPSEISFELSWSGFPDEFVTKNLIGSISFRVDDFKTIETKSDSISPSSLLRLISLFNVSRTFGDLTNLNFKEKFKKGFQADRVEGLIEIKIDEITILEPIVFRSGSGEFKWSGFIQKNKNGDLGNLSLDVLITLPLREYLPAYALILGGPITAATVYIAGKAFKKPINKLSSGKWRISGNIKDPKTEFIEWFK